MSNPRPAPDGSWKRIKPPGLTATGLSIFLSGCGVVLVIGGLLMWYNHANPARMNDNIRPMPSPDGKLQAVLFRRTSLGKDAFTTHVTILPTGTELPNRSGKAFIAAGEPPVILRWVDDRHLIIDEPEGTKVILRAAQVGDVRISDH